jgi:hypothetical protein
MDHPKAVGDRTTLAVMLALRVAGYDVYLPFGENTRCDLVIDDGSRLLRLQCKTGRLREGAIRFATASSYAHHPQPQTRRRHYQGEIDYFAVHCPETDGVYLIPIDDVAARVKGALRVDPARNSQRRRIRQARPYEIEEVVFPGCGPLERNTS